MKLLQFTAAEVMLLLSSLPWIDLTEGLVDLTVEGGVSLVGPHCPGTLRLFCDGTDLTSLRWSYNGRLKIFDFGPDDSETTKILSPDQYPAFVLVELTKAVQNQDPAFGNISSILTVDLSKLEEQNVTNISCGDPRTIQTEPVGVTIIQQDIPDSPNITEVTATYDSAGLKRITVVWNKVPTGCPEYAFSLDYIVQMNGSVPSRVNHSRCGEISCLAVFNTPFSQSNPVNSYFLSLMAMNNIGNSSTVQSANIISSQSEQYITPVLSSSGCITSGQCLSSGSLQNDTTCHVQYTTDPEYQGLSTAIMAPLNTLFQVTLLSPETVFYFVFSVPATSTFHVYEQFELVTSELSPQLTSYNMATIAFAVVFVTVSLILFIISLIIISVGYVRDSLDHGRCLKATVLVLSVICVLLLISCLALLITVGVLVGTQEDTCNTNWLQQRDRLIISTLIISLSSVLASLAMMVTVLVNIYHGRKRLYPTRTSSPDEGKCKHRVLYMTHMLENHAEETVKKKKAPSPLASKNDDHPGGSPAAVQEQQFVQCSTKAQTKKRTRILTGKDPHVDLSKSEKPQNTHAEETKRDLRKMSTKNNETETVQSVSCPSGQQSSSRLFATAQRESSNPPAQLSTENIEARTVENKEKQGFISQLISWLPGGKETAQISDHQATPSRWPTDLDPTPKEDPSEPPAQLLTENNETGSVQDDENVAYKEKQGFTSRWKSWWSGGKETTPVSYSQSAPSQWPTNLQMQSNPDSVPDGESCDSPGRKETAKASDRLSASTLWSTDQQMQSNPDLTPEGEPSDPPAQLSSENKESGPVQDDGNVGDKEKQGFTSRWKSWLPGGKETVPVSYPQSAPSQFPTNLHVQMQSNPDSISDGESSDSPGPAWLWTENIKVQGDGNKQGFTSQLKSWFPGRKETSQVSCPQTAPSRWPTNLQMQSNPDHTPKGEPSEPPAQLLTASGLVQDDHLSVDEDCFCLDWEYI